MCAKYSLILLQHYYLLHFNLTSLFHDFLPGVWVFCSRRKDWGRRRSGVGMYLKEVEVCGKEARVELMKRTEMSETNKLCILMIGIFSWVWWDL